METEKIIYLIAAALILRVIIKLIVKSVKSKKETP